MHFSPSHCLLLSKTRAWLVTSYEWIDRSQTEFTQHKQHRWNDNNQGQVLWSQRRYLRWELRKFIWLRMHPPQGFQVIQEIMLWQLGGKINMLMSTPLWWHSNTSNFFHLRIVRWTNTIQVPCNLCSQICYTDELFQNILRHNVGISSLLLFQKDSTSIVNIILLKEWQNHLLHNQKAYAR